jgi:hypothetical protein
METQHNANGLNIPPYMYIKLIVNVENLKVYKSFMFNEDEEG